MKDIPDKINLRDMPENSGVYIMKDKNGKIIYIGKAKNLKKRLSSYFYKNQKDPKTYALVSRIETVDTIITDNEMEALILESNLIKKHKPKYNIMLKYGDGYPWIKVTVNEDFPRVYRVRKRYNDKAKYFGPYISYGQLNEHLNIIHSLFPIRKCHKKVPFTNPKEKPCFNYHIKRCAGPCKGYIDSETYKREYIDKIILFLSGKYKYLLEILEEKMKEASEKLQFEKAAKLRDGIESVKSVLDKQKVYIDDHSDIDIIGHFLFDNVISITNMHIREGKLISKENFNFDVNQEQEEIIEDFITSYYEDADFVPSEIIIDMELSSVDLLNEYLTEKRGKKSEIVVPKRGQKYDLLGMANNNAKFSYKVEKKITDKELVLMQLKKILSLDKEPRRIEGFDIGNLLGKTAYASCVSFFNGKPDKRNYRIFGIKTIDTPNDYEMMREAVARRYQSLKNENKEFPDLILIDGGKGQLNAAKSMLDAVGVDIPICSLAKRDEEIFIPDENDPIRLPKNNSALRLLQSVRDEAHRFCNTFHKKQRDKKSLKSTLDSIKGVGEARRKILLKHFKTIDNIKNAAVDELEKVDGITRNVAQNIYDFFHG